MREPKQKTFPNQRSCHDTCNHERNEHPHLTEVVRRRANQIDRSPHEINDHADKR